MLTENKNLLRTPENYKNDLSALDYGIKDKCVWHELPNFHMTTNISCDIMHDIWEGICRYELGYVLDSFIFVEKLFTLEMFNNRIQFFNFYQKNEPPPISKSHMLKKVYNPIG